MVKIFNFRSIGNADALKLEVRARFEAGQFFFLLIFCKGYEVESFRILKLGLVKILKLTFYGEADVLLRF